MKEIHKYDIAISKIIIMLLNVLCELFEHHFGACVKK